MQVLSQNVKSRLIVLSSLCQMFNNITEENPKIDYFLAPLNETLLRDGTYLSNFLLESGNKDYPFINAYKIWGTPNFLSIKFEAFDGKGVDNEADKLMLNHLTKKMRAA